MRRWARIEVMCNRYRAASVTHIRDVFGFTYIESGPPRAPRYNLSYIAPLKLGPFVRSGRDDFDEGQWGLTPVDSPTLEPRTPSGERLSTNNARWDAVNAQPEKRSFRKPWEDSRRCIVPVEDFDEPYYPHQSEERDGPCVWTRFRRADGQLLGLAGLWNDWTDPRTGEVFLSYTLLTINCDEHPLLRLMHRPERDKATKRLLPPERQDKRTVVPLEREQWEQWLHGTAGEAAQLVRLPSAGLYVHDAVDPGRQVPLGGGLELF